MLLDEIEKAHRDVFNVLLQVLDDGRLTDSQGRTVDFTNTVIVMTSNLGSEVIQNLTESGRYDAIKPTVLGVVAKVSVRSFSTASTTWWCSIRLARTHDGYRRDPVGFVACPFEGAGTRARTDDAATQRLTEQGYDPVYGARPLKRAIQRSIENPLAAELLSGRFHPGDLIRVDVDGEAFRFERVAAA